MPLDDLPLEFLKAQLDLSLSRIVEAINTSSILNRRKRDGAINDAIHSELIAAYNLGHAGAAKGWATLRPPTGGDGRDD